MREIKLRNAKIIILFVIFFSLSFILNYKPVQEKRWTEPMKISENSHLYSGMPSITAFKDRIMACWIQKENFLEGSGNLTFVEINKDSIINRSYSSKFKAIYYKPLLCFDKEGTGHCIIGGKRAHDSLSAALNTKTIFYINNITGKWGEPIVVFDITDSVKVECLSGWKVKCDTIGNVHIMVSVYGRREGYLKHIILKNNKIIKEYNIPIDCSYFDFIFNGNDKINIAYIGSYFKYRIFTGVFFSCYNPDSGVILKTEKVSKLDEFPAYNVEILRDKFEKINILWEKDVNADSFSEEIYHCYSYNEKEWSKPFGVIGRELKYIFSHKTVSDKNGKMHLIFWVGGGYKMSYSHCYYSSLYNGLWAIPVLALSELRNIAMTINNKDFLYLIGEKKEKKRGSKTEIYLSTYRVN